jgi:hypothetical protein
MIELHFCFRSEFQDHLLPSFRQGTVAFHHLISLNLSRFISLAKNGYQRREEKQDSVAE